MDVLQTLFDKVLTLESCLHTLYSDGTLASSLLQEADTDSYRCLLQTTVVGVPATIRTFTAVSISQHLHQKEVILRAIEHIMKRDGPGKNVLTFGFGLMSDDENAHISSGLNVEYKYPNNNVSRLHYRDWKLLHTRIGDELMMYLLENLSLFVEIQPTCYLQLTGLPVYNMWSYGTGSSPWVSTNRTVVGTCDTKDMPSPQQTATAPHVNSKVNAGGTCDTKDMPSPQPTATAPHVNNKVIAGGTCDTKDMPSPQPTATAPHVNSKVNAGGTCDTKDMPSPQPTATAPHVNSKVNAGGTCDTKDMPSPQPTATASHVNSKVNAGGTCDTKDMPSPQPSDTAPHVNNKVIAGGTGDSREDSVCNKENPQQRTSIVPEVNSKANAGGTDDIIHIVLGVCNKNKTQQQTATALHVNNANEANYRTKHNTCNTDKPQQWNKYSYTS